MSRRKRTVAVAMALATATGLTVIARRAAGRPDETAAAEAARELAIRDADIAFYQRRVARDPMGAADRAQLGSLLLQRARETGSYEDYLRAEEVARRSLELRAGRNARAYAVLASALLAQHRFPEALATARGLRDLEPGSASYASLLGEVQSEIGDYDGARRTFDSLRTASWNLAVAPRLARWAELNGRTDEALHLLRAALFDASRRTDLPREQVAWFALRLGDAEQRAGHLEEAEQAYRQGLRIFPSYHRLDAAMAGLEAERKHWREAVRYGEDAIATVLEPGMLGVLSDAYAALGDTARAREYVRVMEVAISGQTGPIHRQWSLFLLDHDRDVEVVARKAREELTTRRDIYGWDVLAWALHRQGRDAEARVAMDAALRLGTRDPLLSRHSAAIGAGR